MILYGRPLTEVLPLADLYTEYKDHERLTVFVNKGRECVVCGREGTLLLVTQGRRNPHVDLYTDDFILMTVDHIKAKAKGGGEELSNKQPMCEPCNNKKSDRDISVEEFRVQRVRNGYPQRHYRPETICRLVNNEGVFNKCLAGVA